jgi:hypothetical protein
MGRLFRQSAVTYSHEEKLRLSSEMRLSFGQLFHAADPASELAMAA